MQYPMLSIHYGLFPITLLVSKKTFALSLEIGCRQTPMTKGQGVNLELNKFFYLNNLLWLAQQLFSCLSIL